MLPRGVSDPMVGGGADPTVLGSSAAAAAAVAAAPIGVAREGGGEVGSNSGTDEDKGRGGGGSRSFGGGNRWPRQETLALLKIRSDMDQVFRDSSLKGPLWEEISRKLAELGYDRSSKKCKEKFENLYKYHKRTKDQGRTAKSDGKHYKFFDQLAAFDHHRPFHQPPPPPLKPQTPMQTTPPTSLWPNIAPPPPPPITAAAPPTANPTISAAPPTHTISADLFFSSTSSSTDSDEETGYVGDDKIRKRKWKVFFKRVTKQVIRKQEELQDKFLEAIEKRDHERTVREEAWRVQELARINREHEILIQERSTAAAKDAAVIAFLQKISGQGQQQQNPPHISPPSLASPPPPPPPPLVVTNNGVVQSSSRWPKSEIEALIRLRTDLSLKYQENGPKGPLWEEISAAMQGLGYNRSAKRCKEKWENINKYFKKVKYSNKKRPEDSKTCPYFEQLDALYREKNTMVPLMVQPEQQWPLQHENVDQTHEEEEEEDDDEDSEEQYEGGDCEMVANKAASMAATGE